MTLLSPIQDAIPASQTSPREGANFLPERLANGELGSRLLHLLKPYSTDGQQLIYAVNPKHDHSKNVINIIYGNVRTSAGRWQLMRGIDVPLDTQLMSDGGPFPVGVLHVTGPEQAFISYVPGEPRALEDFPFPPAQLLQPGAVDRYGQAQLETRWADYCREHGVDRDAPPEEIQQVYWDMLQEDIRNSCTGGVNLHTLLYGPEPSNPHTDVAM